MDYPIMHHKWIYATIFIVATVAMDYISNNFQFAALAISNTRDLFQPDILIRIGGDISAGIACTTAYHGIYRTFLWRYDRWIDIPILNSYYKGVVEYQSADGVLTRKEVDIKIDQKVETVKMDLYSSEMHSVTLMGRFKKESQEPILYYIYRGEPLVNNMSRTKLGAARLSFNINCLLEGNYWTDDGTSGRLYFYQRTSRPEEVSKDTPDQVNTSQKEQLDTNWVRNIRDLFDRISADAENDFAGLGILVHNEQFDSKRVVSLRCNRANHPTNILLSEDRIPYFIEFCRKENPDHDGFFLVDKYGNLERTSQYVFPPFPSDLIPDPCRGTRSYSALCASTIKGVLLVGIISENKTYALYSNGQCIYDSTGNNDG